MDKHAKDFSITMTHIMHIVSAPDNESLDLAYASALNRLNTIRDTRRKELKQEK